MAKSFYTNILVDLEFLEWGGGLCSMLFMPWLSYTLDMSFPWSFCSHVFTVWALPYSHKKCCFGERNSVDYFRVFGLFAKCLLHVSNLIYEWVAIVTFNVFHSFCYSLSLSDSEIYIFLFIRIFFIIHQSGLFRCSEFYCPKNTATSNKYPSIYTFLTVERHLYTTIFIHILPCF